VSAADGAGVLLCTDERAVGAIADRAGSAPRLAVDVEANGLFAYKPRLCTVQIAWEEQGEVKVAIVDTLRAPAAPLAALFGASGPVKVLHDLTFDAKLLDESGAPLARVRDTSVAARFLGIKATGLASLLGSEIGVAHDKAFQQHDWAERPLTPPALVYLAADVSHLFALDDALAERVRALDLEAEIEDECAYKLATALRPPRDGRPLWVRIRGAAALDLVGQAVLRRLVAAREAVAEREDVPPFKVIGNDVLLELSTRRPDGATAIRRVRGAGSGRAGRFVDGWARAITDGLRDGAPPEAERAALLPEKRDRAFVAKTRAIEGKVNAWRKREAAARGVDEQAVLPGHCAHDVVALLVSGPEGAAADAIARIPGFGARRAERYAATLATLPDPTEG
jgi:ribonuclease D